MNVFRRFETVKHNIQNQNQNSTHNIQTEKSRRLFETRKYLKEKKIEKKVSNGKETSKKKLICLTE